MLKISIQILIEFLLLVLLFFNVFVFRSFNLIAVFFSILSFLILISILIKFKKPVKQRTQTLYYIIVGGCLLEQGILYFLGLFNEFSINYNVFYRNYISKFNVLIFVVLTIMVEMIRYFIMSNLNNHKKDYKTIIARIIMILNYIFIDYIMYGQICDFSSNYEITNLVLVFVIPAISKHIFLDYVSGNYGYAGTYWYRLIMDLYVYIVPLLPDINVFIETVFVAVLPYLLYLALENYCKKKPKKIIDREKKKSVGIISTTLFLVLVYLVSCQFKYAMVAVGSESMQGTIDKGDAIVYKRYDGEKLNVGDIIAFRHNNMIVIHRIHDKVDTDGDYEAFITKGDANLTEDNWIVTKDNIVGVVKFRVMLIAWPSVLLSEWL